MYGNFRITPLDRLAVRGHGFHMFYGELEYYFDYYKSDNDNARVVKPICEQLSSGRFGDNPDKVALGAFGDIFLPRFFVLRILELDPP